MGKTQSSCGQRKLKPSLIMGTFSIARYKEHTFTLKPGDILYLYTDGVTEAEDAGKAFYGEERLQKRLSFGDEAAVGTYHLYVAFINPYSKHIQEAISFLEVLSGHTEVAAAYTFSPENNALTSSRDSP